MRTPTRIRRIAARIVTGSMLTTVALGLVAAPGMAEEVAPATPGPHTIPDTPLLPEDLVLPAPGDDVPDLPGLELPDGVPMPERPDEPTCEEWRDIFEAFPMPPGAEAPECPYEDDEEAEGTGPGFPVDEIPLPDDVDEPPFPFDPGEIPLPLDPGSDGDEDGDEGATDDAGDDEGSADGSDDGTDGSDDTDDTDDTGSGSDTATDEPDTEVAGSSTEADEPADEGSEPTDDVTVAGDGDTPTPTRVDAGAGGSLLTVDREDAFVVAGLVLALGLLATGGVLLARSTTR